MFSGLKTRARLALDKFSVGKGMLVKNLTNGDIAIFPVGRSAKRVMRKHFPKNHPRFSGGYVLGSDWKRHYDAIHHHPDLGGPAVWIA